MTQLQFLEFVFQSRFRILPQNGDIISVFYDSILTISQKQSEKENFGNVFRYIDARIINFYRIESN